MSVRILLADDHPLYRQGLAGLLATTDDLVVVGEAADGLSAVALADDLAPAVAVLDLNMPGLDGVEVTRRVLAAHPDTAVLILTMYDEDAQIFAALKAGARGYLLKSAEPSAVLNAIRSVASGEAVFGRALARRLSTWLTAVQTPQFEQLTPREREALDLIARGLGNQAIATRMGISAKTARNVVSNILVKLQAADRAEAIAQARAAGLG